MTNAAASVPSMPSHSAEEPVDVKALMEEIRARVKTEVAEAGRSGVPFTPTPAFGQGGAGTTAGELRDSEELRFLNQQYAYSYSSRRGIEEMTSHRWGPVGKLIVRVKRKIAAMLWDGILQRYFEEEREYHSKLVRYLNHVSRYVDARDASNFWEIIRKIDIDVQKSLDRVERASDEHQGSLRATERALYEKIDGLAREVVTLRERLATSEEKTRVLESVALGLESIVARASQGSRERHGAAAGETPESSSPRFTSSQGYLLLENRFRGSEADIKGRLEEYPSLFRGTTLPVMEIGGGRGELQELFREAGVPSFSIDIDPAMVAAATEKGVDARCGDGIEFLRKAPDASLGGVIGVQVVEHLPWRTLEELFALCVRTVAPGGVVVFETINPRSVVALSSNYFRDPTHVWPLHPDTLSYQMTLAGMTVQEVRYLSPVPREAGIAALERKSYMSPRWAEVLEAMNRNFSRLHDLLYGSQDYCVIAKV